MINYLNKDTWLSHYNDHFGFSTSECSNAFQTCIHIPAGGNRQALAEEASKRMEWLIPSDIVKFIIMQNNNDCFLHSFSIKNHIDNTVGFFVLNESGDVLFSKITSRNHTTRELLCKLIGYVSYLMIMECHQNKKSVA